MIYYMQIFLMFHVKKQQNLKLLYWDSFTLTKSEISLLFAAFYVNVPLNLQRIHLLATLSLDRVNKLYILHIFFKRTFRGNGIQDSFSTCNCSQLYRVLASACFCRINKVKKIVSLISRTSNCVESISRIRCCKQKEQ